jgi:hypothetical protein
MSDRTPLPSTSGNFDAASVDLDLSREEQSLYEHHLTELGCGGVKNADGSISTVRNITVGIEGRTYAIPTVWDGKIVSDDEAIAHAQKAGLNRWPAYESPEQASERYNALHGYMERDIPKPATALESPPVNPLGQRVSESAVLDFDGWLSTQKDGPRAQIERYLTLVPDGEREAAKQKLATIYALADEEELDPFDVRDNFEMVRGGFAERRGWDDAKHDTAKLHARLVEQATQRRGERELLLGMDADDDAGKASRDAALANFAFRGAVLGQSAAESFALWQRSAAGLPSFKGDRLNAYLGAGVDLHREATVRLAPVLALAREAFSALSTGQDLEAASETLFPMVDALDNSQRRSLLAALRIMADAAPEETRASFWSNFGKSVSRGGGSVARGVADYGSGYWEAVKLELSFYVPGMEPVKQLEGIAQKLGEHNLEADLRRVQESSYSPIREVLGDYIPGVVERGLYGFGNSIPYTVSAMMPLVGAPATLAAMTAQAYESERFRGLDNGLSDADASVRAATLAPIIAAPQAALERLGARALIGQVPTLNRALNALGDKLGGGAAAWVARRAGAGAVELATERAQDLMQPIVEATAHALDIDAPAVVWRNGKDGVLDGWWTQTAETFVAVLPFTLLGALGGGKRQVEALQAASDLELKAFGARVEDIASFREAVEQGAFSAEDAASALLSKRDANSEEAKAAVAELVTAEKAKGQEANTANVSAMREAGITNIARGADGWTLHHADGQKTKVSSAGAALSIVQDLQQVRTLREAEAIVSIADRWHDQSPEGVKRETVLTGEIVQSDGQKVTATRDGKTREKQFGAGALDRLREEGRMDAQARGDGEIDVLVNGSNEVFRERVGTTAAQIVQRLELNQSASSALTAVHEQVEASWRSAILAGSVTMEETKGWIASIAPALDPAEARDEGERSFRERVQRVANGQASETEVQETLSELAVGDVISKRKDGSAMPAGSITAAVDAMIERAVDATEVRGLKRFRAVLRAIRQWARRPRCRFRG